MVEPAPHFIRQLAGHSGCRLALYRNGGGLFVRKTSAGAGYNRRLEYQYLKQRAFDKKGFSVPKCLGRGLDAEKLFYFDMEFINCQSLNKRFPVMPMSDIPDIVDRLFQSLPIEAGEVKGRAQAAIAAKLAELKKETGGFGGNAAAAFKELENYDFSGLPESECHGDLTLENIMISDNGKIYLLDLLDSFLDSWVIDLAKILQDVDLHWSYRHTALGANTELRLLVAREEIFKRILAMRDGRKTLADIYHTLLLNLLRIVPYARDEETRRFLDEASAKVLNRIKERP